MKIKRLELKNFRSYKEREIIHFEDLTAFVGKNDIGKSTILEALDIFFNDGSGVVKIDKADINVQSLKEDDTITEISVTFDDLPTSIIIDASVTTTLADEYLLNAEGFLEVIKRYKNGSGKPSIYIRAVHPTNDKCSELLMKKSSELKKIIEDNEIECVDKRNNSLMRSAIWRHYSDELKLEEVEIDASKADAKAIWDKLCLSMPVYSLFQADRENSDGDSEIQDPLQEAVKQIINDESVQEKLAEIASIVRNRLVDVSNRTLEKIHDMDVEIANSLSPVIPSADKLKWETVFKSVTISGDESIPINKRGSGIKRLILLNFFRADAERRAETGDTEGVIYAIEEPETSQHYSNQRLLINTLKELSSKSKTQIIITTHSPVIVKQLDYDNVRMIYQDTEGKHVTPIEQAVLKYPSMNEINYISFGEATEEYHDELYGFLESNDKLNDYKQGKPLRDYIRANKNGEEGRHCQLCSTEYIRHQIHHPENHFNEPYNQEELRNSIDCMREYIKSCPDLGYIWESFDEE